MRSEQRVGVKRGWNFSNVRNIVHHNGITIFEFWSSARIVAGSKVLSVKHRIAGLVLICQHCVKRDHHFKAVGGVLRVFAKKGRAILDANGMLLLHSQI